MMIKIFNAIVLVAAISTLAITAAAQTAPAELQTGMRMMDMSAMQNCPMAIPGVSVSVDDSADGITIKFSTTSGDVAELQRRVESIAKMHSDSQNGAMMPGNMKAGKMIPFTLKLEATSDGARLLLTPKDPAQLLEFRTQIRTHVEHMQKGECSMMQDMMKGMPDNMMRTMKHSETAPADSVEPAGTDHSTHH